MEIRKFKSKQAVQWLSCGLRFWRRSPVLWTVVSLIVLAIAYLLASIPILGTVMMLFLAPAILISGLMQPRTNSVAVQDRRPPTMNERLLAPLRACFGVFAKGSDAFVIALVGLVVLAVGLLVQMVFQVSAGPALIAPVSLLDVGAVNALHYIGGYLLTWVLAIPLVLFLAFSLPLFFIEDVPLPEAMGLGLRALARNAIALIPFIVSLLAPLFVAGLALRISPMAGQVLLPIAGFITVPLFVNASFCSYKLTFH
jgi:hypothetical protein